MKNILLIFSILTGSLLATAQAFEDPATFCDGGDACTRRMKNISAGYNTGTIDFTSKELAAYSGECVHLNPDYDPEHIHHGAFVFKTKDQQTVTNGVFSFFSETDPYAKLTSVELANRLGDDGSYVPVQVVANTHLEIAFVTAESDIRYWFRSTPGKDKLFLIGRNSGTQYSSLVFCELNLHLD